jgi:hypothetical protein
MQRLFQPLVKIRKAIAFFVEEVFQSESKREALRWKKYLAS